MRIALLTTFSPDLGGGSVQLKSLLPELQEFEIVWHYLARHEARSFPGKWLGEPLLGGPWLRDVPAAIELWRKGGSRRVRDIARALEGDAVWLVAMNEAVLIGLEAVHLGMPLHVTVHDDPVRIMAHSTRYRWVAPWMARAFERLLREAKSVDTISDGMRLFYGEKYGLQPKTIFRYVPSLPAPNAAIRENGILRVGHIGSVYTTGEFRRFMQGLCLYGERAGVRVKFVRIGSSPAIDIVQRDFPNVFEDLGELPEPEAIPRLAACDFVYCMYPQASRYELFRRTSQPMKLSTYIQAQRPIFAHTPGDSTLASLTNTYGLGIVCRGSDANEIASAIARLRELQIAAGAFEKAREGLLGAGQITELSTLLRALRS